MYIHIVGKNEILLARIKYNLLVAHGHGSSFILFLFLFKRGRGNFSSSEKYYFENKK
jgi:hypothetical protein